MTSGPLTTCFKKRIFCLITNPRRGITIAWIISLVLVFVCFIVACVAAARLRTGTDPAGIENASAFAAMWTAILLIAISVFGTVVMRRFKAALPIGGFLGVIFVMCQQMLIVFVFFADLAGKAQSTPVDQVTQAKQAMAVFSFFLYLIYGFFGLLLGVFRDDIIVEDMTTTAYSDNLKDVEQPPEYN